MQVFKLMINKGLSDSPRLFQFVEDIQQTMHRYCDLKLSAINHVVC